MKPLFNGNYGTRTAEGNKFETEFWRLVCHFINEIPDDLDLHHAELIMHQNIDTIFSARRITSMLKERKEKYDNR